ncbi:hypothetical protein [Sandarakinorhabdus sp. DWP1-3-1]|uniref:hypothetical protein n=1 Tax=Sandarakinorhabdus sp. DWP1-3-1 TaxID=2804627 RepID=UPI003CF5BE6B
MRMAMAAVALSMTQLPVAALAQDTPPGLKDLVGARAGQAEGELGRRGYDLVRTETGDDRKWTYWFNATYGRCVSIATMDGRYNSIVETPVADCQDGGGAPADNRGAAPPASGARYAVDGQPVDLGLVCYGEGQHPSLANRDDWVWNSRTNRYDFGNRVELTSEAFDASVTMQLWDNGGRIRLPKSLVPPLHSGGNDGWWPLDNVVATPDQITASYRLNGLNKPRVVVDRRAGRISITGLSPYGFRGQCDLIDGEDHRRF